MLKKLQNLLFEEEEIEEEVIEEEPEPQPEPVRKRKKETKPEPVETETKQAETKTTMQRIDVTQPLQTIGTAAPAANESVFKPAEPEKPKGLGLTVDELEGAAKAQPEAAKPAAAPAPAPAKPSRPRKSGYDFSPVISPIFGVDETDMNAVQATVGSRRGKKDDENVSKVISPIYGMTKEEESLLASAPKPSATMKPTQRAEESVFAAPKAAAPEQAEDDVPEFSLDDILRVGDEQYAKDNRMVMQSLFPDLDGSDEDVPDETTVVDSRNVTPYGTMGRKN